VNIVKARALDPVSYAPFGGVVAAGHVESKTTNMGTAERFNFLDEPANFRPAARANLCLFRCRPYLSSPIPLSLLERHPYSTQAFVPMGAIDRYLVVVSGGQDKPDEGSIMAFVATGRQGITYRPGIWHHPIIALDRESDFACLVWEDGSPNDTEIQPLSNSISVEF
jgi:ureidoglycolate lyase